MSVYSKKNNNWKLSLINGINIIIMLGQYSDHVSMILYTWLVLYLYSNFILDIYFDDSRFKIKDHVLDCLERNGLDI